MSQTDSVPTTSIEAAFDPASIDSPITVCTLFEGDFHKGVGTLVNSLARAGYCGTVWAGYRGPLPPWAQGCIKQGTQQTLRVGNISLVFVLLETRTHFSQFKAVWMTRILEELAPAASGIYYFDPDIFILCPWTLFEEWLDFGIAACEDVHFPLNPSHPIARRWQKYLTQLGKTNLQPPAAYLNSGLLGVPRGALFFLAEWQSVITAAQHDFNLGDRLKTESRASLFFNIDQDALTMTTCFTDHQVSWVGTDGMAFARGEWLTLHAYNLKPWRHKIPREFLVNGRRPDRALRLYWSFVDAPIRIESRLRCRMYGLLIPLFAFLSRFYCRP